MKSNLFNRRLVAYTTLFSLLIFMSSCSVFHKAVGKRAEAAVASTKPDVAGSGTVSFVQRGNQVEMKLNLAFPSMAGKMVAVHIHEHGDCGDAGNSAHGHWNPTNSKHGKWGSAEYHLGDIGNVQLDQAGKGTFTLKTDKWSVGTGAANDVVGRGIIVHGGTDDYTSQPAGNAGPRIGCGVIEQITK